MAQHLTIAILFLLMTSPFLLSSGQEAYAQSTLNVTASQPCFLNYTANGLEMMQQCGLDEDYLRATTVGFDWVTGGLWPLIVVTVLIVMTYLNTKTVFTHLPLVLYSYLSLGHISQTSLLVTP